jgi:hypothetical protein
VDALYLLLILALAAGTAGLVRAIAFLARDRPK